MRADAVARLDGGEPAFRSRSRLLGDGDEERDVGLDNDGETVRAGEPHLPSSMGFGGGDPNMRTPGEDG